MTVCDPAGSKRGMLDARDVESLTAALLHLQPGYVPEWDPVAAGRGKAVARIAARYIEIILQRLNQTPDKNLLAFLDLLGVQLIPARPARVPVVFRLPENAVSISLPVRTQVAAPPPPESTDQIVFETEQATGIASARLKQVYSHWPGRDQFIDHSVAVENGQSFTLFEKRALQDIPHHLYLAHDTLLALAGKSRLDVTFGLLTGGSEHLSLIWEYWDGEIWREFHNMQPACSQEEAQRLDSTNGLRRNGRFRLESDCAETEPTTVNGVMGHWVRARLDERLVPNPEQILPVVESIRLSSLIMQPLIVHLEVTSMGTMQVPPTGLGNEVMVRVVDADGAPVRGVEVQSLGGGAVYTNTEGVAQLSVGGGPQEAFFVVLAGETVEISPVEPALEATLTLDVDGMLADQAFNDGLELDISKPFFPFGQQPQPGAAFYFTNADLFSKPGARLQIYVQPAKTPQDDIGNVGHGTMQALAHTVSWEYWNGRRWKVLAPLEPTAGAANATPAFSALDFSGTGIIEFVVPHDMVPVEVNGQEEKPWFRVRLLSGGYGYVHHLTIDGNNFNFVVTQPPSVGKFMLGYTWQYGPFHAERVFAYNDFAYVDRSAEAKWEGQSFEPFRPSTSLTPGLYMGFDKVLPVDRLGLYFDIEERPDEASSDTFGEMFSDTLGPALIWEYWNGFDWKPIVVDDETRHLRVPGLASFIGPENAQSLVRCGTPLYWLRARLKEDGPPGAPTMRAVYPNAVWALQHETIADEPLGVGTGRPNQVFQFRRVPVLEDEQIEVRELAGLRANVEWRILARQIFGAENGALKRIETWLASDQRSTEFVEGELRLVRDRFKRVVEAWTRWHPRRNLFFSDATDRHYVLERTTGQVFLGNGQRGRVPPEGARVLARRYRTGGGVAGNVPANAISQLLSPAGAVEKVFNPVAAAGGADNESVQAFARRGPRTLANRGRGISLRDYATLARESAASVAVAWAIGNFDAGGSGAPGKVTLIIIPYSSDPRPWPSFGLREQVRRYVAARTPADIAAADGLRVTGPRYAPVDVQATVVPIDPATAGGVERSVRATLAAFLHPLTGGPGGEGWEAGRGVYLSDVAAVLQRVPGLDYVQELALLVEGRLQGEKVAIRHDRIAVAGELRIKVLQSAR